MKIKKRWKLFTTIIALVASLTIVSLPLSALADSTESSNDNYNQESMDNLLVPTVTTESIENGYLPDGADLPDEFIVNPSNPSTRGITTFGATNGYEKWTKISKTRVKSKAFIRWHPSWKNYQYNISYYYFSTSTMSVSANVGYGAFSMTVAKKGSSGQLVKSNPKKWTRPGIYGNVDATKWKVKKYNGANIYVGSTTKYTSTASSTYVKSRNK